MRYLVILLSIIFANCGGTPHQVIDPTFKPYYDRFIDAGLSEGHDFSRHDITIEFGDVYQGKTRPAFNNIDAVCLMGEDIVIVDKDNWDGMLNWGNLQDAMKELLIYHELGHCFLDRLHVSDRTLSGKPTSIMYPMIFPQYADDKAYYIHELFHPSVKAVLGSFINL